MSPKPTGKPSPDGSSSDSYSLYFKGSLAGFGVAIYREEDDSILFKKKVSLHYPDFTAWEAELMALKLGLTKAVSFRINHISIYCDNPEIFELVMGRSVPKDKKIALLMDEVQRIRQQFSSSIPFLVASNEIKFVYKLAKETLVSNISIPRPRKKTCGNCFNDGIKGENMFSADLCSHYFCVECMKEHIEVSLNEGGLPRCPHDGCTSNLTLRSCDHLLTPKQREMWEQRIKEESIPVCDRFHCPNPRCWALMSKTELTESTEEDGVRRCCYKCRKHFCINCKVPWHSNLSCKEHKSSGREPITIVWRQCRSCLHKIKLSEERMPVTCRCGYKFCYACGAQWKLGGCCSHHLQEVMDWVAIVLIFLAFITNSKCNPKQERVVQQLLEQVQLLSQKFDSSKAILVSQNNIKFAFKLAREAIVSQTSRASEMKGETCVICLEETKADRMFVMDKCLHRHCYPCVNQLVEVKLRNGTVPTCLDYECKLKLSLENCFKVLKPKVIELWKHMMKEESIPLAKRIYCPYINCSTLMSKTEISRSNKSNDCACIKCSGLVCIDCKVPSHSDLSCAEYKKLHPDPVLDDLTLKLLANDQKWRQCVKCRHLIELNQGCNHMTCRCGYQFCYKCGVEWKKGQVTCPTGCPRTGQGYFYDGE